MIYFVFLPPSFFHNLLSFFFHRFNTVNFSCQNEYLRMFFAENVLNFNRISMFNRHFYTYNFKKTLCYGLSTCQQFVYIFFFSFSRGEHFFFAFKYVIKTWKRREHKVFFAFVFQVVHQIQTDRNKLFILCHCVTFHKNNIVFLFSLGPGNTTGKNVQTKSF